MLELQQGGLGIEADAQGAVFSDQNRRFKRFDRATFTGNVQKGQRFPK